MNEQFNKTTQSNFFNQKIPKDHIPIRSIIYKKTLAFEDKRPPILSDYKFPILGSSMHLLYQ